MEQPIVIEHRDALVYMLTEAAELEHAIMCQYLFAGFSLKRSVEEGVTERQLRAIQGWRMAVMKVAADEMLHLALVNNLLASLGAAPRVGRPNLPHRGRHYPPGVVLALVPFSERALRHFLFLERPEGINLQDAEGFESLREAEPLMSTDTIVPRPQDFGTVGHLYRSIEDGFERLVERHGEEWVFIGDERGQATPQNFHWPDLVPVTDLKSAHQAIDTIVEQGEGPRGHWRDAHYGRFLEVLGEFLTMKKEDASFEPARPVIACHVRQPVDSHADALVSDPVTAQVLDAFNVAYEILLYTLARFFGHGHEDDEQLQTLADVAVIHMIEVIEPLGDLVTALPVGAEHPGLTAGPSFELFYHSGYMLPHTRQAWIVIHERIVELRSYVERITAQTITARALEDVSASLDKLARMLASKMPGLHEREIATPWGLGLDG